MSPITDVDSLINFTQNAPEIAKRIKESGAPLVLTVDGRAELVVQDAAAYRRLLEQVERQETLKALREGLQDVAEGRTRPVEEAFEDFKRDIA
ncbi:MAG: type II toxin-antitoxin system Phd/YefM family antitoxin [bacterium]|nr:type II toxin-antitoxin system Phd/YefM family antitoxin [bacterium]